MGTGKILSVRNSVVDPYTFQILLINFKWLGMLSAKDQLYLIRLLSIFCLLCFMPCSALVFFTHCVWMVWNFWIRPTLYWSLILKTTVCDMYNLTSFIFEVPVIFCIIGAKKDNESPAFVFHNFILLIVFSSTSRCALIQISLFLRSRESWRGALLLFLRLDGSGDRESFWLSRFVRHSHRRRFKTIHRIRNAVLSSSKSIKNDTSLLSLFTGQNI